MSKDVNVLLIYQTKDELLEYLRDSIADLENVQFIIPPDFEESTLIDHAKDANIMIGWRPTLEILQAAPNLSLFINPGAGVQNLIELFRELNQSKSVTLVNNHGNAYFTAQHGVGILLALTNRIIPYHKQMVDGGWRDGVSDVHSIPLRNRKIGLLGYGAVNRHIHRFLSGFEVDFGILRRDWNRPTSALPTAAERFNSDQLDSFLSWTDTLIISVPSTKLTNGLIKAHELELLGSDGILVNLARGLVVDEASLYRACQEKFILGGAIDVWYDYTPETDASGKKYPYNYPFHKLDNIVISPHRAASPFNDFRSWAAVIENIRRFASGRDDFLNVVSLVDEY